ADRRSPAPLRSELARLLQHLAGDAEALQTHRHPAVDGNDVDRGADLLLRDAVVERAPAVRLPLVQAAERAQHGEVHQAARLRVDRIVGPAEAPAPGGYRLLERPGELVCG